MRFPSRVFGQEVVPRQKGTKLLRNIGIPELLQVSQEIFVGAER